MSKLHKLRYFAVIGLTAMTGSLMPIETARGQSGTAPVPGSERQYNALLEIANTNVIGILGGSIDSLRSRMVVDIGHVIGQEQQSRVVAVLGQDAMQNIDDLFSLRSVDVALVQSDVIAAFRKHRAKQQQTRQLRYISRLTSEEIHIVAASSIKDIKELDGKVVNFGMAATGTPFTAVNLLLGLGISPRPIFVSDAEAHRLLRAGKIAASIRLEGKPSIHLSDVGQSDGLRLLSVPVPKDNPLGFAGAKLSHDDYPMLIARGAEIETIAVDLIMITRDWSPGTIRRFKIDKFVKQLLVNSGRLKGLASHRKWKEFDPFFPVAGVPRFGISPERTASPPIGNLRSGQAGTPVAPANAAASKASPPQPTAEQLFKQFKDWSKQQK